MTITVARVEAFVFRAPIATPVQTSFGIMRDRPAVFVRVTDADGVEGWGEIWCNFPAVGAEHRARLVTSVFLPMLEGKRFDSPEAAFKVITQQTEVLALQAAEPGPIAQCIAGIDTALWDLSARRAKLPLWKLLGGSNPTVRVYASGLNPTDLAITKSMTPTAVTGAPWPASASSASSIAALPSCTGSNSTSPGNGVLGGRRRYCTSPSDPSPCITAARTPVVPMSMTSTLTALVPPTESRGEIRCDA